MLYYSHVPLRKKRPNAFMSEIKDINSKLHDAFIPLIELEEDAIKNENLELLTDIVEHGSLEVYNLEKTESKIAPVQNQVHEKLKKTGLGGRSLLSLDIMVVSISLTAKQFR